MTDNVVGDALTSDNVVDHRPELAADPAGSGGARAATRSTMRLFSVPCVFGYSTIW